MDGDRAFTELLLGMGLRSFSMHPSQILSIKQRVLRADTHRWAARLEQVLQSEDPQATLASRHVFSGSSDASTRSIHDAQRPVSVRSTRSLMAEI